MSATSQKIKAFNKSGSSKDIRVLESQYTQLILYSLYIYPENSKASEANTRFGLMHVFN